MSEQEAQERYESWNPSVMSQREASAAAASTGSQPDTEAFLTEEEQVTLAARRLLTAPAETLRQAATNALAADQGRMTQAIVHMLELSRQMQTMI